MRFLLFGRGQYQDQYFCSQRLFDRGRFFSFYFFPINKIHLQIVILKKLAPLDSGKCLDPKTSINQKAKTTTFNNSTPYLFSRSQLWLFSTLLKNPLETLTFIQLTSPFTLNITNRWLWLFNQGTPTSASPPIAPKLVKEAPHPFILRIFALLVTTLKQLSLSTYHHKSVLGY